jgi:hypothetical protein
MYRRFRHPFLVAGGPRGIPLRRWGPGTAGPRGCDRWNCIPRISRRKTPSVSPSESRSGGIEEAVSSLDGRPPPERNDSRCR